MTAFLSFVNDTDFANWWTYREAHKILKEGFGIEAGDSFWLFDPKGSELALFKRSIQEKTSYHDELLADIIRGKLDVIHGAGNFSFSNTALRPNRYMVAEALHYLATHARVPIIWTNHGDHGDLCNLGGGSPVYQRGDLPDDDAYILDLLLQYGIRYFWLDHHSSNEFVFSFDQDGQQPVLIRERTRAGHTITCFRRFRGALPKAPTALTLHEQLTDQNIEALLSSDGACAIYQHWGAHRDTTGRAFTAASPLFPPEALQQLRRLVKYRDSGDLCIERLGPLLACCNPREP